MNVALVALGPLDAAANVPVVRSGSKCAVCELCAYHVVIDNAVREFRIPRNYNVIPIGQFDGRPVEVNFLRHVPVGNYGIVCWTDSYRRGWNFTDAKSHASRIDGDGFFGIYRSDLAIAPHYLRDAAVQIYCGRLVVVNGDLEIDFVARILCQKSYLAVG